jgi:hypothetical protein
MHYYEYNDTEDKIIHLLVAAIGEGLYKQAISECAIEYGQATTDKAVTVFNEQYANLIRLIGGR